MHAWERRVAEIAGGQDNLITRDQLFALGVGRRRDRAPAGERSLAAPPQRCLSHWSGPADARGEARAAALLPAARGPCSATAPPRQLWELTAAGRARCTSRSPAETQACDGHSHPPSATAPRGGGDHQARHPAHHPRPHHLRPGRDRTPPRRRIRPRRSPRSTASPPTARSTPSSNEPRPAPAPPSSAASSKPRTTPATPDQKQSAACATSSARPTSIVLSSMSRCSDT